MITDHRDDVLIAQYIDPDPHGRGVAEARLAEHGTSVWAIVAYWKACQEDVEAVAHDFHFSRDAVEAALAFYRRHQDLIDARVLLNYAV